VVVEVVVRVVVVKVRVACVLPQRMFARKKGRKEGR
jgi:hypothetical protein